MGMRIATALSAGLLITLAPAGASAESYEIIGFCKRNIGTAIACIVAEKVGEKIIEKIVEKKVQDWWDAWQNGDGKSAASPSAQDDAAAAADPQVAEISQGGIDYRTLMSELDDTLGGASSSLSDGEFSERLAAACRPDMSRMICGEFSPLFPDAAVPSSCEPLADQLSCEAEAGCHWRFNLCIPSSQ